MPHLRLTERGKTRLLIVSAVCLTLLACETALRLWHGISPLDFSSFRSARGPFDLFGTGRYEATLGWVLKEGVDRPGLHTLEHGIRRNSAAQSGLRPGHVLVVGSSFTQGVQVADEESWPAQLERLADRPVDNAAVGGYALDQIVLRAEQLLPAARPKVLILAVMDSVIEWNGYSITSSPKPFFVINNGTLVARNIPVPTLAEALPYEPIIRALSYSHVLDRLMARVDPSGWYSRRLRVGNDPVDVSCRLLQRLKQQTDEAGIRAILVSELWAPDVTSGDMPPPRLAAAQQCARALGYQIIDTFGAFRTAYEADPQRFNRYYVVNKVGRAEHFSPEGNRRIAAIVAAALIPELAGERP
jgi:lysophospholipase L1-like esterase